MKRPNPLNNDWFKKIAGAAFQLHQKVHAMQLHFMTGYSYPKYNGRSRITMESFIAKHRNEMGYYTRLGKRFQEIGLSPEKFLYVGRVFGYTQINELESKLLMQHYWYWAGQYDTSKGHYAGIVSDHLLRNHHCNLSTWDLDPYNTDVCDCFRSLLTNIDNRGDSRTSCDDLHAAIWLIKRAPGLKNSIEGDAILELQFDKMMKYQEFCDWWCLL